MTLDETPLSKAPAVPKPVGGQTNPARACKRPGKSTWRLALTSVSKTKTNRKQTRRRMFCSLIIRAFIATLCYRKLVLLPVSQAGQKAIGFPGHFSVYKLDLTLA
jgi:hypothetical protein